MGRSGIWVGECYFIDQQHEIRDSLQKVRHSLIREPYEWQHPVGLFEGEGGSTGLSHLCIYDSFMPFRVALLSDLHLLYESILSGLPFFAHTLKMNKEICIDTIRSGARRSGVYWADSGCRDGTTSSAETFKMRKRQQRMHERPRNATRSGEMMLNSGHTVIKWLGESALWEISSPFHCHKVIGVCLHQGKDWVRVHLASGCISAWQLAISD
ncbi:hypothetical protein Tco_1092848 [Tanacetum coccineum]|uniref:Uncharacterized protein n=1 Tax=Tanacetum coccineum TaxID=301880 RepID=A0ABQ5IBD5_9ASTR